jgi:putative oxygen-independent coproporphyrinogen III oxidase
MLKVERLKSKVSPRLSFYIHIPYCLKRCGYCDFNTYTPAELRGSDLSSVSRNYISAAIQEIKQARSQVGMATVNTVFFGGGTPSLMPAEELAQVIKEIAANFELLPDAEITIEVNPDSVSREFFEAVRAAGANRISMGMQSAVPHVLKVLDRTHNPDNVESAVANARAAGFEQINVDLIYGSPNESFSDWQYSVDAALSMPINHISAYALIVEKGTKLAAQINRGEIHMPSDDETAEKYRFADQRFAAAGFDWYEISNWSKPGAQCAHNMAYWDGSMWWGIGPGAHSYYDNRRWWNVKHPSTYIEKLARHESPVLSEELLTVENRSDEFIMLQIRRREGIPHDKLSANQLEEAHQFLESGHLMKEFWQQGRLVLSLDGRLIADRIVRSLVV